MNKKKSIILLVMFLINNLVIAQAYIPMLNNTSWNIAVSTPELGLHYKWIEQGVDVIIGSFTYKKYIDVDNKTEILAREDIATKRVYRRINNVDVLLYDFSLEVGDTVTLGNGKSYKVYQTGKYIVNGGLTKVLGLYDPTNPNAPSEGWVEGIGGGKHPFIHYYELDVESVRTFYTYDVACCYKNNVLFSSYELRNGWPRTTCPDNKLSTENYNLANQKFTIYPNPFSTEAKLILNDSFANVSLEIYTLLGEKVRQIENLNSNEVIIKKENLVDGIYLFVLKQNEKILQTKKVIIQK